MVIDHVSDTNKTLLFQLSNIVDIPEFVKDAAETTTEDTVKLTSKSFAYPEKRLFPVHTPADTWLSLEYFDKFASSEMGPCQTSAVRERLERACRLWRLDSTPAPSMAKEASTSGSLISYTVNGDTQATVRVHNQADMHKVATDLVDNRPRYPWGTRRDVARQLLACGYQPKFTDRIDIEKTAGYGTGTIHDAEVSVQQRIGACRYRHEQAVKPLEDLLALLHKSAKKELLTPELLDKTAALLDAVDRFAGFHRAFPAPERELFSITLAHMDDLDKNAVRIPSGQMVHRADIESFKARRFIRDHLGIDNNEHNVVEKVAAMNVRKSQLVYEFLSE